MLSAEDVQLWREIAQGQSAGQTNSKQVDPVFFNVGLVS